MKSEPIKFRWLGVGGVELSTENRVWLIDPFLSRPPFWYLFGGRPRVREDLLRRHLSACDAVFVTHSHYDHLMDVPAVCRMFSATAYGSGNSVRILLASGVPAHRCHKISSGDRVDFEGCTVEVLPGKHGHILGRVPFQGDLPEKIKMPMLLREYRMDEMFSLRFTIGGKRILFWNHPEADNAPKADILVCIPYWREERLARILDAVSPERVIPLHWENFFQSIDRKPEPLCLPPGWGNRSIRRLDMDSFAERIELIHPEVRVILPDLFQAYMLFPVDSR